MRCRVLHWICSGYNSVKSFSLTTGAQILAAFCQYILPFSVISTLSVGYATEKCYTFGQNVHPKMSTTGVPESMLAAQVVEVSSFSLTALLPPLFPYFFFQSNTQILPLFSLSPIFSSTSPTKSIAFRRLPLSDLMISFSKRPSLPSATPTVWSPQVSWVPLYHAPRRMRVPAP